MKNNNDMLIKRAEPKDIDEIVELESDFEEARGRGDLVKYLDAPYALFLTAIDSGVLAGYMLIIGEDIVTIAVKPEYRRRGAASELIRAALLRISPLYLEVRAGNAPAIALYKSAGFEKIGLRRGYYPDGEDAILMKSHKNMQGA